MSRILPTETYSFSENPKRDIWDSFLISNSVGNLWQTIDYGESIKQIRRYTKTVRLVASRGGVAEGLAQGTFSEIFGFGTVMDILEGPVLSMMTRDRSVLLKAIISNLEKIGVKNRLMGIRVHWPCKWGYVDLFENMGYRHVGSNITYTVDLGRGEEDLWRRINGNKRRNIRKALDRGVEFEESSNFKDIERFYDLYLRIFQRPPKSVPPPLSWFQALWNSQSPKDSSKVFFARWRGNDVSSVFATIHAKTIYALGWGYLGTALEVRPNELLHWKIMEWGCNRGFLKYHMGDVHPEKGASEGGTWRWKKEWNGELDYAYIFRKSISKYGLIERVYNKLTKQE
jgi:hypothetical protein